MNIQPRFVLPNIPDNLQGLIDLALDVRWSWSHASDELWKRLDPTLWEVTNNPWHILQTISRTRLLEAAADREFLELLQTHVAARLETLSASTWFEQKYPEAAGRAPEAAGETPDAAAETSGAPTKATTSMEPTTILGPVGGPRPVTAPLGPIAYFSMEFGMTEALPIYSGGLGILAGDLLKAASDLGVPLVGVGLLWQQGYFRQALTATGGQIEFFPFNDPGQLPITPLRDAEGEWVTVGLRLPRRDVHFRTWQVRAGRVRLYLLDSNHLTNSPVDRGIVSELYGGGHEMRLQQEMALGIGGWRLLRELGIAPDICHLNEGHAAFAVLERARSYMQDHGVSFDVALTATRTGNLFTTHTPVEAGHDRFPPHRIAAYLGDDADALGKRLDRLLALGRHPCVDRGDATGGPVGEPAAFTDAAPFNTAYLAIRGSGAVNGVSRLHGEVSRGLFQCLFPRWPRVEVPVGHVTNGVHVPSWDSQEADTLWTDACGKGRWLGGIEGLGDAIRQVSDEDLWAFRDLNRRRLIAVAREHVTRQGPVAGSIESLGWDTSCLCDPGALTIGFARRFATYKRPNLLLHDPDRLERLLCGEHARVQLVLAGKAHPADEAGKAMIKEWTDFIARCTVRPHIIFLVDYDMGIAEHLVHGVDLWINTPRRPWEASGTSGMKVLVNGGLNLSELDGWWAEAYEPAVGWALGDGLEHAFDPTWDATEAEQLYGLLENEIIPEFYDRDEQGIPRRWVARIRESMARLTPQFSTNRMMQDYLEGYYLPGATSLRERTVRPDSVAAPHSVAESIEAWRRLLNEHWGEIEFIDYSVDTEIRSDCPWYTFEVGLRLGNIPPSAIVVELYAEPLEGQVPERHVLMTDTTRLGKPATAPPGSYTFRGTLPVTRAAADYTPRVVPWHSFARIPLEANHILWYR